MTTQYDPTNLNDVRRYDRCMLCGHERRLHHAGSDKYPDPDTWSPGSNRCHFLGQHGGDDKVCGAIHSHGPYRGPPCPDFIEATPSQSGGDTDGG